MMSSTMMAVLPVDLTDDVHDPRHVVLGPQLGEHGHRALQAVGHPLGGLQPAGVRRDDHHVPESLELEVVGDHGQGRHVIDRDAEEALQLAGVQVHGEHPVDTGGLHDVGHQAGGDGLARAALLVLAGVAHPRHDRGDPVGGGQPGRLGHDQELHEVLVDRPAGGLDDEHVGPADALPVLDVDLAVGEGLDVDAAQLDAQLLGDLAG